MPDEILVYAEHQGGKLFRSTWEALAAGQSLARDLGVAVSAVILGGNISPLASELAGIDLREILAVESPVLSEFTPEGTTQALREVIREQLPRFVVLSHTYQVRDFAPRLAASLDRGLI